MNGKDTMTYCEIKAFQIAAVLTVPRNDFGLWGKAMNLLRPQLVKEPCADWECCFRECKMNLTNPARTDPIIATYSSQFVGLSLWAINNHKLIPNMRP
jgi:hypothetical protein